MASSTAPSGHPRHTVIVGGGIIGASTLYYAASHPSRPPNSKITLIEASAELAPAASGKSGGFLALDWHGPATSSLAELSYELHRKLAQEGGGEKRWGYRTVETLQVGIDTSKSRSKCPPALDWVDPSIVTSTSVLGGDGTTAQVTPKHLVEYLAEEAVKKQGVRVRLGTTASGLDFDINTGRITRLHVRAKDSKEGESIECDRVVLAAGPWTGRLLRDLVGSSSPSTAAASKTTTIPAPLLRKGRSIDGSRAHSIVVRGTRDTTGHCLFTDMRYATAKDKDKGRAHLHAAAPEVYARSDGTVYVCGGSDGEPLPASADEVDYDADQTGRLREQIAVISPEVLGEGATLEKEQACYLPGGSFNGPLIDGSADHGLYIASGHTCWGITLGPGTGKVMAELLYDGKATSADIGMLRA